MSSLGAQLYQAVKEGNVESVRPLLIKASAEDVNYCELENGDTALICGSKKGYVELVKILLTDNRVDVNKQNKDEWTALTVASSQGHTEIVKMLLANGRVDVNMQDVVHVSTALMMASSQGHTEIVKMLLADNRVDVNMQDDEGWTALMLASYNSRTKVVKMLLADRRVDVYLREKDGKSALDVTKNKEIKAMLHSYRKKRLLPKVVSASVSENTPTKQGGNTVGQQLYEAAIDNRASTVSQLLLTASIDDVNYCDPRSGFTALMRAAQEGRTEIVKMLLADNRVADVNGQNKVQSTALMCASLFGHSEVVKMLLAEEKIDVNLKDQSGGTALMMAIQDGHTEIVKMLLADGKLDINTKNMEGSSALMMASRWGRTEIVEMLLAVPEIHVDATDKEGKSALDRAEKLAIKWLLHSRAATSKQGWLTARLLNEGVDAQLVKECQHALVTKEGFVTESDFAEAEDVDAAYLRSIGITGKGIQNRLLKLHRELYNSQHADVTATKAKSDVILSDTSSVAALTAQLADLQIQYEEARQLLVAAGLMDPAGSTLTEDNLLDPVYVSAVSREG